MPSGIDTYALSVTLVNYIESSTKQLTLRCRCTDWVTLGNNLNDYD